MSLILRTNLPRPLTHDELDSNLTYLFIDEWSKRSYRYGQYVIRTIGETFYLYRCVKTHTDYIYNVNGNDFTLTNVEDGNVVVYWRELAGSGGGGIGQLFKVAPLKGSGTEDDPLYLGYNADFILDDNDDLSLNLDSTILVTPIIQSSSIFFKNNGITPFGTYIINGNSFGQTSNSNTIITPTGSKINYIGNVTIPAPNTDEDGPTSVAGNYTFSPSPPIVLPAISNTLNILGISSNTTFLCTLYKPKSGLIVVGNQVKRATGFDTKSTNVNIQYSDLFYFGYLEIGSVSLPISNGVVNTITAGNIEGLGNYNFGDKSQVFTVNDGVTNGFGAGWRLVFAYPAAYGDLIGVNAEGSTFNQVNAFIKRSSDVTITTLSGISVLYRVYVAVADNSWDTTLTIF